MTKIFKIKTLAKFIALAVSISALGSAVGCSSNHDEKAVRKAKVTVQQAEETALKESNGGTVIGYEILKKASRFKDILNIVRSHHERIDRKRLSRWT